MDPRPHHYQLMISALWLGEANTVGGFREDVPAGAFHSWAFPRFWVVLLPLWNQHSLWFQPLPSSPLLPPASFALPRWYLGAVEQEAGEQTAGEATLMLSCAICCGHMTEQQNLLQQHHHTWQTHQSPPKREREEEERPTRKHVWKFCWFRPVSSTPEYTPKRGYLEM